MGLSTSLSLANSAYTLDEIVEWCAYEYGLQGHMWNYSAITGNTYLFEFASTRALVRFGLTWNLLTIRYKPKHT